MAQTDKHFTPQESLTALAMERVAAALFSCFGLGFHFCNPLTTAFWRQAQQS